MSNENRVCHYYSETGDGQGEWLSYARTTEERASAWYAKAPRFRMVTDAETGERTHSPEYNPVLRSTSRVDLASGYTVLVEHYREPDCYRRPLHGDRFRPFVSGNFTVWLVRPDDSRVEDLYGIYYHPLGDWTPEEHNPFTTEHEAWNQATRIAFIVARDYN